MDSISRGITFCTRFALRRLGRITEAELAYQAAIARCDNAAERTFMERRRQALSSAESAP